MQVVDFITSNENKIEWANEIASKGGYDIRFKKRHYEFEEGRSTDPEEIALKKVRQGMEVETNPFVVEDSGFFIDALNGFPGTFVKFGLSTIGIKGIITLLNGVNGEERTYSIKSAIGYGNPELKTKKVVISSSIGKIGSEFVYGNDHGWGEIIGIIIPDGYATTVTLFSDTDWQHYRNDVIKGDAFSVSLGKILKIISDGSV